MPQPLRPDMSSRGVSGGAYAARSARAFVARQPRLTTFGFRRSFERRAVKGGRNLLSHQQDRAVLVLKGLVVFALLVDGEPILPVAFDEPEGLLLAGIALIKDHSEVLARFVSLAQQFFASLGVSMLHRDAPDKLKAATRSCRPLQVHAIGPVRVAADFEHASANEEVETRRASPLSRTQSPERLVAVVEAVHFEQDLLELGRLRARCDEGALRARVPPACAVSLNTARRQCKVLD